MRRRIYVMSRLYCIVVPFSFLSFFSAEINCSGEPRALIVETFIKTNSPTTSTQLVSWFHFNLGKHEDMIPSSIVLINVSTMKAGCSPVTRLIHVSN